jgi:hypothetical protein
MNLIDALKSGFPLKRPAWTGWVRISIRANRLETIDGDEIGWSFLPDDVLAEDWEIQEPSVPITHSQFCLAYRDALIERESRRVLTCPNCHVEGSFFHTMVKALGFPSQEGR